MQAYLRFCLLLAFFGVVVKRVVPRDGVYNKDYHGLFFFHIESVHGQKLMISQALSTNSYSPN